MTPPCGGGQKAKEDSTTTEAAAEAAPEATPEPAAKEVKPQEATSTSPKEELSPRMKKVRDEMIKIHEQVHKMKIADTADMMEEPVEEIEIPIKKAKTDAAEQVAIPMPWKEPNNLATEALEDQPSTIEASAPLMEVEEESQAKKSDVEEWTILDKSNSPTPDKEMPKTSTGTNPQGAE